MAKARRSIVRGVLIGLGLLLGAGALLSTLAFRRDMDRAHSRVQGRSLVFAAPQGDVEYLLGGEAGPRVLVVHGSGGGWDQGELLATASLSEGFRWIAPSRFAYLRSTFSPGASFDDQAHAFAGLLDHLGADRVAVIAFSHGGPSALLFALLYSERVSSLTLISAGVATAPPGDARQRQADRQGEALMTIFRHDFVYWALSTALRGKLLELMGASAQVRSQLAPEQLALTARLIEGMNPASLRAAGAAFDNRARMPDARIAGIPAPTLVIHARDDGLQLFRNAEFAVDTMPNARLLAFDHGGHLLLAVQQARIRQELEQHILGNAVIGRR